LKRQEQDHQNEKDRAQKEIDQNFQRAQELLLKNQTLESNVVALPTIII
jgi:hypothetical protein